MIKRKSATFLSRLALYFLILPSLCLAEEGQGLGPFSFDEDLRTLPPADITALPKFEQPLHAPLLPGRTPSGPHGAATTDVLVQYGTPIPLIASPINDFPGISGGNPPDTNGVVGPNHYIQTINTSYAIWDKTGTQLVAPTDFRTFFSANGGTGTSCDSGPVSDPVVLYDPLKDRYIMTILAGSQFRPTLTGPFYECIAVSKTNDPVNGGWWRYVLLADNNWLNDFPKLGVWPDAYYMSANMYSNANGFENVRVWAIDKSSILGGGALNEQHFDVPSNYYSLLPSNMHGTPPPSGQPNVFAAIDFFDSNVVHLWNFHVDWAVPGNSTFGDGSHAPDHNVSVVSYTLLSAAIPQPGTSVVFLDTLGDRLQFSAQYRNIGGTESLWLSHPVDTGGNIAGIRWYEIDDPSGTPTLFQQGTWDNGGDGVNRWMSSMAADRFGNAAVGYNVSDSSSVYPGIRYAGRLASDALGTLGEGEATLIDGGNNIINCTPKSCTVDADCGSGGTCTDNQCSATCTGRWGDYSGMSVDPVDDCTFWFTGEYVDTGGNNRTRIGNFLLAGCEADLSVTKDGPVSITVGSEIAYTITVSNDGPVAAQFVTLNDTTPSGTTFVSFTQNTGPTATCTTPSVGSTGTVECTIDALADGDSATFTLIVHVENDTSGTITNTAEVSGQQPDPDSSNNTASAATIVRDKADLHLTKQCKPDTPIAAGQTATCTILVSNLGPGESRDVVVTDTVVSSGPYTFGSITTTVGTCGTAGDVVTCNLGVLAVGNSVTITVEVTSDSQVDINDTATVASSTPDPNPDNNTATGAIHFFASADLAIMKTVSSPSSAPYIAGTNVTYTLDVTNHGPSEATNVVVMDTLPGELSNVSVTPSQGSCEAGFPGNPAQPLTCTLGSLADGEGASITVTALIDASTPDGTYLNNNASVSSYVADTNNGNNSASAIIQASARADLVVVKTSDQSVYKPSSLITYTVTITNDGPSDAQAIVVTDNLPAFKQALYQSDTGGCTKSGYTLTCPLGTLAVGESTYFNISEIVKGARGTVTNEAIVDSSTTDPNASNNTSTLDVIVGH